LTGHEKTIRKAYFKDGVSLLGLLKVSSGYVELSGIIQECQTYQQTSQVVDAQGMKRKPPKKQGAMA